MKFASAALAALLASAAFAPALRADTKKAAHSTICAVTGETIADAAKASGKAMFKGKTYYFCCPGCDTKFAKSPEKFARVADLKLEKMALAKRAAAIEAQLKALDKAPAQKEAIKHGGAKTETPKVAGLYCAITEEEIASADDAAGKEEFGGKTYYFCCPGCVSKFKADPAKYAKAADAKAAARAAK